MQKSLDSNDGIIKFNHLTMESVRKTHPTTENIFNCQFRIKGQILLNEGNIKAYKIQEIKNI